jgi:hypothetical protein
VVAIPGPNRSAASFVADVTPRTLAGAAAPAAFRVISPIFGQLVTFSMPANFVVVAENFCPIVPGEAAPYPSCAVKG